MLTIHIDRRASKRRYCIGIVDSFVDLSSIVGEVSPHFMLFLAVDATSITDEILRLVARKLLDRGLSYLCVWGNDCGRVHNQFDLERHPIEAEGCSVMTTWHSDEPLSEALWFFANVAYPDEDFEPDCCDWVSVSVLNSDWELEMKRVLIDENDGWPP